MAQLIEFASNHFLLVAAFFTVLGALLYTGLRGAGDGVAPRRAVELLNRQEAVPVDVRGEADFKAGHIVNAVHVPLADLKESAARLARYKERPLLVYCDTGSVSGQALAALKRHGFGQVHRLQGGLNAWRADQLPLESGK